MDRHSCAIISVMAFITVGIFILLWRGALDPVLENTISVPAPVASVKLGPTSGAKPASVNEVQEKEEVEQDDGIVTIHVTPTIKLKHQ